MATWGLRRPYPLQDRNQWFWMLWPLTYNAGHNYRPLAGDHLKVWDGNMKVYEGTIVESRSFLYSSHDEVKLALGGVSESDLGYLQSRPTSGWCVAIRSELANSQTEDCPIDTQNRWKQLS
jgi:hypothetical protein